MTGFAIEHFGYGKDFFRQASDVAPSDAAPYFLTALTQYATVLDGIIIRLQELNVHPDLGFNNLVARGLAHRLPNEILHSPHARPDIVVAAIENSAPYISFAFANALTEVNPDIHPSILRIRKGDKPSAVLYEDRIIVESIHPITASEPNSLGKFLHAEVPREVIYDESNVVVIIDDVMATGDTMRGAVRIVKQIYPRADIVVATVFGKQHQRTVPLSVAAEISLLTIDGFSWNEKNNIAILSAIGFKPVALTRPTATDFRKK